MEQMVQCNVQFDCNVLQGGNHFKRGSILEKSTVFVQVETEAMEGTVVMERKMSVIGKSECDW